MRSVYWDAVTHLNLLKHIFELFKPLQAQFQAMAFNIISSLQNNAEHNRRYLEECFNCFCPYDENPKHIGLHWLSLYGQTTLRHLFIYIYCHGVKNHTTNCVPIIAPEGGFIGMPGKIRVYGCAGAGWALLLGPGAGCSLGLGTETRYQYGTGTYGTGMY